MRLINTTHAAPTTFRPFSTIIEHGWCSLSGLEPLANGYQYQAAGRLVSGTNRARALQRDPLTHLLHKATRVESERIRGHHSAPRLHHARGEHEGVHRSQGRRRR
jgi:hypothetical protein